jgi:hypothetical protein
MNMRCTCTTMRYVMAPESPPLPEGEEDAKRQVRVGPFQGALEVHPPRKSLPSEQTRNGKSPLIATAEIISAAVYRPRNVDWKRAAARLYGD